MKGNFKVGEVLVGQNFINDIECNGMECTVIGGLQQTDWYNDRGDVGTDLLYEIEWVTGEIGCVSEINLRRKQPPTGEASILNMFVVAPPKRMKEPA